MTQIFFNFIFFHCLKHFMLRVLMVVDLYLAHDGNAEGDAIIIDMEGATLSHLARVNIITLKKLLFYVQVFESASLLFNIFLFKIEHNQQTILKFPPVHRKHYQFACAHFTSSTLCHSWINCWQ